jgi:hypothetical protein
MVVLVVLDTEVEIPPVAGLRRSCTDLVRN